MGDFKSKKTLTKLGKLFGVSNTNLVQSGEVASEETLKGSQERVGKVNGAEFTIEHALGEANEDAALSDQENDLVSPLPRDHLVSNLIHNTISPGSSVVNSPKIDSLSHPSTPVNYGTTKSVANSPSHSSISSHEGMNMQFQSLASNDNPNKPTSNSGNNAAASVSRSSSTVVKTQSGLNKQSVMSRSSSIKGKNNGSKESLTTSNDLSRDKDKENVAVKPRFKMLENGNHEHHLRSAKRQEKLTNMLKDLLGAKKLRDEAKSAVPNILQNPTVNTVQPKDKPPTLFAGLVSQVQNNTSPYHGPVLAVSEQQDSRSFVEKYGRCQEVVGRGSFGVVRISHKKLVGTTGNDKEILYAVKEFKRRPNESDQKYNRRLTSEFCISSSLKNINIIDTLDLLKDAKGDYCEVMEFCSGGDLYTLIIASGKLEYAEADCLFKQLIRGVNYMHNMGVSHRDLKPENLLLTKDGVLKITDFGNGECFKMAWEKEIQLSEGICGSSPYIAPEEFTQEAFDPRGVDIWACGVIYMAMRTGRQLWKIADPKKDEFFHDYLLKRKDATGYEPIESLKRARCRNVIYSILDPKPERRITGKQILNSEWGREIKVCDAGEGLA